MTILNQQQIDALLEIVALQILEIHRLRAKAEEDETSIESLEHTARDSMTDAVMARRDKGEPPGNVDGFYLDVEAARRETALLPRFLVNPQSPLLRVFETGAVFATLTGPDAGGVAWCLNALPYFVREVEALRASFASQAQVTATARQAVSDVVVQRDAARTHALAMRTVAQAAASLIRRLPLLPINDSAQHLAEMATRLVAACDGAEDGAAVPPASIDREALEWARGYFVNGPTDISHRVVASLDAVLAALPAQTTTED